MSNITVEEMLLKRKNLEMEITRYIEGVVGDFKIETGVSIKHVDVKMEELNSYGGPKQHIVTGISAGLDIN